MAPWDRRVGVVIATRDRATLLARTLHYLCALPESPPIVVVDNASTDASVQRVGDSFPGTQTVVLRQNLGAAARTVGVEVLSTPFVAFSDDDSWWAPGALERAVEILEDDERLGLLAARILVGTEDRLDPTSAVMARSPLEPAGRRRRPAVLGFLACGAVVRRAAYLDIGGFHPRFGVGAEETLLALDLATRGYDLIYADDVVAHHRPAPRQVDGRQRRSLRNSLWTTWLRCPPSLVASRSARLLGRAVRDPRIAGGVVDAVRGAGWVLRERSVVPQGVARDLRLLDSGRLRPHT